MKKAESSRRIFLTVGIAACIVAPVTVVFVALFLLKAKYVVMGIVLFFSVIAFYTIPFSFFAAHEAALAMKIIPVFESKYDLSDAERIEKTAEEIGWKTVAAEKFLHKCKKRHYI